MLHTALLRTHSLMLAATLLVALLLLWMIEETYTWALRSMLLGTKAHVGTLRPRRNAHRRGRRSSACDTWRRMSVSIESCCFKPRWEPLTLLRMSLLLRRRSALTARSRCRW